jgi:Fe2+ transport system protein FeoA
MKMNDITNGKLYYNLKRGRVERARCSANSSSILTTHHGDEPMFAKLMDLRIASSREVEVYKDSSLKDPSLIRITR